MSWTNGLTGFCLSAVFCAALAPGASSAPATASAGAQARYEVLLAGGSVTSIVPSVPFESVLLSVGDVLQGTAAAPLIDCVVGEAFCFIGGAAEAAVTANNGQVSVEAGLGAFAIAFSIIDPAPLIVTALTLDVVSNANPGGDPGASASSAATVLDFRLEDGGAPILFSVTIGDPANILLGVGDYTLTWDGLRVAAAAERLLDAGDVPAPPTLILLGAGLALFAARRRVRVCRVEMPNRTPATRAVSPSRRD